MKKYPRFRRTFSDGLFHIAFVEQGHSDFAYVEIDGIGHVTNIRNTYSSLDCIKLLESETRTKTWKLVDCERIGFRYKEG